MKLTASILIRRSSLCLAALIALTILFGTSPLAAQTTTTGTPTTGTTTTGPTTTDTTTGTTPATSATRQPTVVTNQFNTTSTGAIGARSPGRMVQQGIAEATGQLTLSGNATPEPDTWFKQTFDQIAQNMLTMFSDILTGINTFISGLSGTSGGSSSSTVTFVPPSNAATTWSDTSQTIP
jgi:hypothetical protein